MKISEIINSTQKPSLYEAGNAFMWTDKHISQQLLQIHLNPDIDLASRRQSSIKATCNWIDQQAAGKQLNILDLGCGPGIYAELLAEKGHQVTGVDISQNSIEYARKSAQEKGYEIEYINASYLDIKPEVEKYDLIFLIYTDFGVLLPDARGSLLNMIYLSLKKDGLFIFDVLKDTELEQRISPNNWEATANGFWKATPYLALSNSFLYEEQKVILYQHTIIDSNEHAAIYRFWTHFFNEDDIFRILNKNGFINITFRDDILPAVDQWNGDNVLFTVAVK